MDHFTEGYVSRQAIKKTLENYHGSKVIDYSELRHDSAVKGDGVGGRRLNKIMVTDAMKTIPDKRIQYCVYARWVHDIPASRAAAKLGISKPTYYKLCEQGIDHIYETINGQYSGVKALVELILK
ncbi:hypothetical protein ACOSZF_20345 [Cytobacillus firmus]|uniref:hypothetical protein n=1 Tax=Cytobacillus firmus TaxID=1399 RepID=UPI003B9EF437